jgi:ribose-phosphate pyrophosphokinase
VDNLDGGTVGVSYFGDMDLVSPVVVSPDAGGVYRAKQFREALAKKHEVRIYYEREYTYWYLITC